MASKISKKWIVIPIVLLVGAVLGYQYWKSRQSALPEGIVSGNGRIEAKLVDATAKEALRVREVLVDEGDLVRPGQVVVRLDTTTMEAELAKDEAAVGAAKEQFAAANAAIASAKADITGAKAAVAQQQSEIQLAQVEADRQRRLLAENATSQGLFDVRQTNLETTKQTLRSTQAQADAAQARADAAQSQADAAQQQIGVAQAQVATTKSRINDATLVSPVTGRVLYRLVEPGEVLGPGGKALTVVDLSDVYMEIFLPSNQAAALKTGADARITVDYEPNASAAAYVSFVSPEAQFTPKQVETKSEREKLMFRVKIQVPGELVEHYVERIKTGVRGVGYVKVNPTATWPQWLEKGLLNPPKASNAPATVLPGSAGFPSSQSPATSK
jgi:HlyD family secretion protein